MRRLDRRLAQLEGVNRITFSPQAVWDLTLLDHGELVALDALAHKAEVAAQAGDAVVWTAEEEAALIRLGAAACRDGDVPA